MGRDGSRRCAEDRLRQEASGSRCTFGRRPRGHGSARNASPTTPSAAAQGIAYGTCFPPCPATSEFTDGILRLMGIWEWFGLPLLISLALGILAESFRSRLRQPKRTDLSPIVGLLILVNDAMSGDGQPLMERTLKGSVVALIGTAALVLLFRWALTRRVRERASTSSHPGEGLESAHVR